MNSRPARFWRSLTMVSRFPGNVRHSELVEESPRDAHRAQPEPEQRGAMVIIRLMSPPQDDEP